jgi:hypothetical protein
MPITQNSNDNVQEEVVKKVVVKAKESQGACRDLWAAIRNNSSCVLETDDSIFCVELCELNIADKQSLTEVRRVVEEDIIMQHVLAGEFVHIGVLSSSQVSLEQKEEQQMVEKKKRGGRKKKMKLCQELDDGGSVVKKHAHIRALYLWEDAERKKAVCFDMFARETTRNGIIVCKVNVMQVIMTLFCKNVNLPLGHVNVCCARAFRFAGKGSFRASGRGWRWSRSG